MQKRNHFHRLQQKHYSRGAYRNPYFQTPKKNSAKYLYFAGSGLLFLLFLSIYFYGYPDFDIRSVEIRGLETSSNVDMESRVRAYLDQSHALFFHNTNRFLFSEKKLREFLSKTFAFDRLDIRIKKQTLQLMMKEKTSDIIWQTGGEAYLADLQGVITQKIEQQTSARTLPKLIDRNNKPVAIGEHVLSENQIKHILAFEHILTTNGFGFKEAQIDIQAGKWMGIVTLQGYIILFDPDGDLQTEFDRLKTVLRDTIKDTSHLQYIDLRFGDHVYYK